LNADSEIPQGTPRSAPYRICRRTISRFVSAMRLPGGDFMTSDGMRYSNIDPDQEISADPAPRA
jgi:hypothetical protein